MENVNINTENQTQGAEGGQEQTTTYTQEQMLEMLQKETDRRVTAALQKQEAKFKQKLSEADKLAKMDEQQKAQYEFEQRVKELEDKEKQFNLMKNQIEAQKVMASRGLPVEFVEYIVADDAETMMARIETFEKSFKAAVNDAVTKKIASPAPKAGGASQTGITREEFKKMTVAQQAEIYRTNPSLYKSLIG